MNKKQRDRQNRLMPAGIPRYVRIYDNNGQSFDCYTVVFTGNYPKEKGPQGTEYEYTGMSHNPFHPQGFCQHGSTLHKPCDVNDGGWPPKISGKGRLGTRIPFKDLPADCQSVVISDYKNTWSLN